MLVLKPDLQNEGQLYANFFFYILIVERKLFAFQYLNFDMSMYFSVLTGVEKRRFNSQRIRKVLLKNVDCEY